MIRFLHKDKNTLLPSYSRAAEQEAERWKTQHTTNKNNQSISPQEVIFQAKI